MRVSNTGYVFATLMNLYADRSRESKEGLALGALLLQCFLLDIRN